MPSWALENAREGIFYYRFYTPLYEKDIKYNQNMPMETTTFFFFFHLPLNMMIPAASFFVKKIFGIKNYIKDKPV